MSKVYIAGKITGDPDYKAKFDAAATVLREQGHVVLNPATLPAGLSTGDYMRICFAMIDCVDMVVLLSDWRESAGAMLEHQHCRYTGKPCTEWPKKEASMHDG